MSEENKNQKVYELGYHVLPSLTEDKVGVVVGDIKSLLEKAGAEIVSDQYPALMDLAYDITKDIDNKNKKFKTAYFGWIKFAVEAEKIKDFEAEIKKNENLLRHILIITVRESTLAAAKIAAKQLDSKKVKSVIEEKVEIDEKVVDAKIDELLKDEGEDDKKEEKEEESKK